MLKSNEEKGSRGWVSVKSLTNQSVIADQCRVAESFWQRLKGLIGADHLDPGQGMLFPRCNDIHMWFMRIPIDVVFIRRAGMNPSGEKLWEVSSTREHVQPWRLLPVHDFKASETLELPAGTVRRLGISEGDQLCIS